MCIIEENGEKSLIKRSMCIIEKNGEKALLKEEEREGMLISTERDQV